MKQNKSFGYTPDTYTTGAPEYELEIREACDSKGNVDWSKITKTKFWKALGEFSSNRDRGDELWDGEYLEWQIFNLLSKAVYRITNDGDDPLMNYQPGNAELTAAWKFYDQFNYQFGSKFPKNTYQILSALASVMYNIEDEEVQRPSSDIKPFLRKQWEIDEKKQREDEAYYESLEDNEEFSRKPSRRQYASSEAIVYDFTGSADFEVSKVLEAVSNAKFKISNPVLLVTKGSFVNYISSQIIRQPEKIGKEADYSTTVPGYGIYSKTLTYQDFITRAGGDITVKVPIVVINKGEYDIAVFEQYILESITKNQSELEKARKGFSKKSFATIRSICTTPEQRKAFNQLVKSFANGSWDIYDFSVGSFDLPFRENYNKYYSEDDTKTIEKFLGIPLKKWGFVCSNESDFHPDMEYIIRLLGKLPKDVNSTELGDEIYGYTLNGDKYVEIRLDNSAIRNVSKSEQPWREYCVLTNADRLPQK